MSSASKTQGAGWRNGVHRTSERRRVGLRRFSYVESENVRKRGCHYLENSPSVHPKIPVSIGPDTNTSMHRYLSNAY